MQGSGGNGGDGIMAMAVADIFGRISEANSLEFTVLWLICSYNLLADTRSRVPAAVLVPGDLQRVHSRPIEAGQRQSEDPRDAQRMFVLLLCYMQVC